MITTANLLGICPALPGDVVIYKDGKSFRIGVATKVDEIGRVRQYRPLRGEGQHTRYLSDTVYVATRVEASDLPSDIRSTYRTVAASRKALLPYRKVAL